MDLSIYSLANDEGRAVWFLNSLVIFKATAEQTGGAYGLIENRLPAGFESPYHVHGNEDETFYVLEGTVEFVSEGRRMTCGSGAFVFLPRGLPHGFRVLGASPANVLLMVNPGGFEQFVNDVGEPTSSTILPDPTEPDMPKLIAAAAKYGIEILGPLPA